MKKSLIICFFLFCCVLTACGEKGFSYDDALAELIKTYNTNHTGFVDDKFEESLSTTSTSYRNLIMLIYQDSQISLINASDTTVICGIAYFDYADAFQRVTSDTYGFVHDIQNLYDLGISQTEINEYVYDYLYLMILSCNKSTQEIDCTLTQSTVAPFNFIDNGIIVNQIMLDINQLVYDCENYAKDTGITEEIDDTFTQEFSEMIVDKTYVMNYAYNEVMYPISIKVTSVLTGQEAKEKALSISANNSKLVSDNMIYLEYEVHNFSADNIVFTSNFYDCDTNSLELFADNITFVGINKSCNIASGSTIMMNDLIIVNHDDLVWYDKNAGELYLLDQNK